MFAKEIRMNEYLFVGNKCLISSKYSFITKCVSLCLIPPASYAGYGLYIVILFSQRKGHEEAAACEWPDRIKCHNVRSRMRVAQYA
jgi:hypothetical protein